MIKKLIPIIIIFLVLFQSAWAMDQTYRVLCDNFQNNNTTKIQSENYSDNHAQHHEHRCSHGSAPYVVLTQYPNEINRQRTRIYYPTIVEHLVSITTQPPTPPPTYEKRVIS